MMSYSVSRRTQEIGIRLALGAQHKELLTMVLAQAARLVGIGLVVGLIATAATGRLMAGLLFGMSAGDPMILLGVAGALALLLYWLAISRPACAQSRSNGGPVITNKRTNHVNRGRTYDQFAKCGESVQGWPVPPIMSCAGINYWKSAKATSLRSWGRPGQGSRRCWRY